MMLHCSSAEEEIYIKKDRKERHCRDVLKRLVVGWESMNLGKTMEGHFKILKSAERLCRAKI